MTLLLLIERMYEGTFTPLIARQRRRICDTKKIVLKVFVARNPKKRKNYGKPILLFAFVYCCFYEYFFFDSKNKTYFVKI